MINRFAFSFDEARLSTTIGSDIEFNKFCGQVSTNRKVISNKYGDFLSQYNNNDENDIPVFERIANLPLQIRNTPHKKMTISNHIDANKDKIEGILALEDIFGFCKRFKKVTENLGFYLMFKTADLQHIIYTSMVDDKNVAIINLYLYISNLIPSVESQLMSNEATHNNYKVSYDEYFTERLVISDMIAQIDIGSTQQANSPRYLICAHQTHTRVDTPNKKCNIAIFDNLGLRKFFVEIDSQRHPKDSLLMNYE